MAQFSLPRGRRVWRALMSDPTQEYILFIPHSAQPDAPVLVSFHGISRNAHEHAAVFTPICEKYGAVMLVPIFTQDLHKDYQRLGRKGRGNRIDLLLHQFLAEVAFLSGADVSRTYVFGFSAGAQLAHRYAMAHPHRVARALVAAAGWYTFPDQTERFPYGIRPVRTLEGITFNPEEFLRVPIEVVIGTRDTALQNVRSTERTVKQQGKTRLDRARNWAAAMREAAAAFSLEPQVTLSEVPGVGHSFTEFCGKGDLVERLGRSLFGDLEPVAQPKKTSTKKKAATKKAATKKAPAKKPSAKKPSAKKAAAKKAAAKKAAAKKAAPAKRTAVKKTAGASAPTPTSKKQAPSETSSPARLPLPAPSEHVEPDRNGHAKRVSIADSRP